MRNYCLHIKPNMYSKIYCGYKLDNHSKTNNETKFASDEGLCIIIDSQ